MIKCRFFQVYSLFSTTAILVFAQGLNLFPNPRICVNKVPGDGDGGGDGGGAGGGEGGVGFTTSGLTSMPSLFLVSLQKKNSARTLS